MEPDDIMNFLLPTTGNVGNYTKMQMYGQPTAALNLTDIVKPRNLLSNSARLLNNGTGEPAFGFTLDAPTSFMESDFMKNMLGWKDKDGAQHMGWGGMALGTGQALVGLWDGMRNYGLQEKTLNAQMEFANRNFKNQETALLADASDRDRARAASREGASNPYQSLTKTLNERGIA